MKGSKIEWTENTWNPFSGCVKVSPGCDHCYAEAIAENKRGSPAFPHGFDLTLRPHKLNDPLKWKTPSRIFVNSMSDLFLGTVPSDYLKQIWDVMLKADHHQFQILTKRPVPAIRMIQELELIFAPHIWLGVSAENQHLANQRLPVLLEIPAYVRFVSCEPLLGPINLAAALPGVSDLGASLHWVIDGGESGPDRRPASYDWFRSLRAECQTAKIAYFHKQGNAFSSGKDRLLDGRTWDEYPTSPTQLMLS